MNNVLFYISAFCIIFISGCNRDEILPYKPGEALQAVENLDYTLTEPEVLLTWSLPTSYPEEIVQPVSVQIRISVDGKNAGTYVLENAPESYTFSPYDPQSKYRFTVKVMGDVDNMDPHLTDMKYSLGKTVAF